jgi:magnesium-transporting ATPase (P-type)
MITDDHALTAATIGRQIGLCQDDCPAVLVGAAWWSGKSSGLSQIQFASQCSGEGSTGSFVSSWV